MEDESQLNEKIKSEELMMEEFMYQQPSHPYSQRMGGGYD